MRPREEENVERILDHFGGLEKLVERIQNIDDDADEWYYNERNELSATVEVFGEYSEEHIPTTIEVCNALGLKIPEEHVVVTCDSVELTAKGWEDVREAFWRVSDIVEEMLEDIGTPMDVVFDFDRDGHFTLSVVRGEDDDGDIQEEVMG